MRTVHLLLIVGLFALASTDAVAGGGGAHLTNKRFWADGRAGHLDFKIRLEDGVLLGVDLLKCGVDSWTDDKGTDIGTKSPKKFYGDVNFMTSGSGEGLVVTVNGKHKPADGARRMSIRGVIQVVRGVGPRQGRSRGFSLVVGSKLKCGPYTFVVDKVESSKDMLGFDVVNVTSVTLKFHHAKQLQNATFLRRMRFLGPDGKEVRSKRKSFMGSFKGGGEHQITLNVQKVAVTKFDVDWEVFSDIEHVEAPLVHSGPIEARR